MRRFNLFYIAVMGSFLISQNLFLASNSAPLTMDQKGYVGTLPNLTRNYEPEKPAKKEPVVRDRKSVV